MARLSPYMAAVNISIAGINGAMTFVFRNENTFISTSIIGARNCTKETISGARN